MASFNALGWVDWTLLAVMLLSVLVGLWRGLVFELMSLVGWVVAYVLAQVYAGTVAPYLPIGAPGSSLQQGAALVLTFIAVLVVWTLLARLLRLLVHATPLTVVDRTLGAGFGALRGALLLLLLANVVALTPAVRSPPWQQSQGAAWLAMASAQLKPMLPSALTRHLAP